MITEGYKESLTLQHAAKRRWGNSVGKFAIGAVMGQLLSHSQIVTLLDYGCGQGELKRILQRTMPNIQVTEFDPGIPGKDVLPEGVFDMVVSVDVLEHVEPEQIDKTVAMLLEKARLVSFHNIACYPTRDVFRSGPFKGRDVHLTIQQPTWWRDTFTRIAATDGKLSLMEYHDSERRGGIVADGFKKRTTIVYERLG